MFVNDTDTNGSRSCVSKEIDSIEKDIATRSKPKKDRGMQFFRVYWLRARDLKGNVFLLASWIPTSGLFTDSRACRCPFQTRKIRVKLEMRARRCISRCIYLEYPRTRSTHYFAQY